MSKRKKDNPTPEEDEDEEDNIPTKTKPPQKVYDFHKKTTEVYPERLLELNQQFVSSISSQIKTEPYSVLVGNCLDYVRQYFNYEDDLLKYSPWLATRLKQSRSDIVKCLQETIDVYEALARHDFDRIVEKSTSETSSDGAIPSIQIRPPTATTTSSSPAFSFAKSTTNNDSAGLSFAKTTTNNDSAGLSFAKTATNNDSASFSFAKSTTNNDSSGLSFAKSTTNNDSAGLSFAKTATNSDSASFSFAKSTASSDSTPGIGFSFSRPVTTTASSDSTPGTGFNFKTSSTTTTSPEKTATTTPPFNFSIPNTGFGTATFGSPTFGNQLSTEKSISTASSISFAPSSTFTFAPTPSAGTGQQGTTEDNEDEASEPPEPEKVEHEADAKLTYRCRMGVNKAGKLIKRGPVQVVLKEANEKRQLIVRSDDTLGRLYLNILWSKLIELKKNSTKDLTFVCKLNPGMAEVKEGEFVMILLRFDNETERNDAYEKLDKERT